MNIHISWRSAGIALLLPVLAACRAGGEPGDKLAAQRPSPIEQPWHSGLSDDPNILREYRMGMFDLTITRDRDPAAAVCTVKGDRDADPQVSIIVVKMQKDPTVGGLHLSSSRDEPVLIISPGEAVFRVSENENIEPPLPPRRAMFALIMASTAAEICDDVAAGGVLQTENKWLGRRFFAAPVRELRRLSG